jgi:hypothetical protein
MSRLKQSKKPTITKHRLIHSDGTSHEITAALLGFGTSEREYHNHPEPRNFDEFPETWKCSRCRWFEVSIFYIPEDDLYAVYTIGKSSLLGEEPRSKIQYTESAFEVIEILTDRRSPHPRLPIAAARCIAQAASVDDDMTDAYINRAAT